MDICSIKNVTIPIKSSSNVLMWASVKHPLYFFYSGPFAASLLKGIIQLLRTQNFQKTPPKTAFLFVWYAHVRTGIKGQEMLLSPTMLRTDDLMKVLEWR